MVTDLSDAPYREARADLDRSRYELAAIEAEIIHGLNAMADCIDSLKATQTRLRAARAATRQEIEKANGWLERFGALIEGGA